MAVSWLYFFLHQTVTSLWTKQRLSQAVSREAMRQPVNCGFSLKYFGLTVWKECKGPHLFHSLDPTLAVDFHFFSHWSHCGWSHTHIKHIVLRGKEYCMDKTLKSQYSSQFQGSIWGFLLICQSETASCMPCPLTLPFSFYNKIQDVQILSHLGSLLRFEI